MAESERIFLNQKDFQKYARQWVALVPNGDGLHKILAADPIFIKLIDKIAKNGNGQKPKIVNLSSGGENLKFIVLVS